MADPGAVVRNPRTGREIIGSFVRRVLTWTVLTFAAVWLVDYAVLRVKIATNHQPYGTVTVQPLYAVPQKDHKTQYMVGDPADQQCVNSLFPHMGDSPCWYLTRHTNQQIDM